MDSLPRSPHLLENRQYHSAPLTQTLPNYESKDPLINSFFEISNDIVELPLYMKELVESKPKTKKDSKIPPPVYYTPGGKIKNSSKTILEAIVATTKKISVSNIPSNESDLYVKQFLDIFECYRFIPPHDAFQPNGKNLLTRQLTYFILKKEAISLTLPAFPCKSPNNKEKVLGILPDRGEEIALERLHQFLVEIQSFYPHGANLTIVSDGRVFSDLVGVAEDVVDAYNKELRVMASNYSDIRWKCLEDYISAENPNDLRAKLQTEFGISKEEFEKSLEVDDDVIRVYTGFVKFLSMDRVWPSDMTNSKIKKECAKIAREMMLRNVAFSTLVEKNFPRDIRLSIHAHSNIGPKFAFSLIPYQLTLSTPWHNAIVEFKDGSIRLMHKSKALELPGEVSIVQKNGRDWYIKCN